MADAQPKLATDGVMLAARHAAWSSAITAAVMARMGKVA